ncbi:hypothetical protein [Streptomyces sp. NPDC055134]
MIHGLAGLQGAVEHSEGQDDDAYAGQDAGDDVQPGVGDVVAGKTRSRIPADREAWLEAAIDEHVTPADRRILAKAAEIMEHLADS